MTDNLDKYLDLSRLTVRVGDIRMIAPIISPDHPATNTIMFVDGVERGQYLEEDFAQLTQVLYLLGVMVEPPESDE